MFAKIVKWFVAAIGLSILVIFALFFTRETSMVLNWQQSGVIQSDIIVRPDSTIEFAQIDTADFLLKPIPSAGDRVYKIGDSIATYALWQTDFGSPQPVGRQVRLIFIHKGDTLQTTAQMSRVQTSNLVGTLAIEILRFLISLSYLAVGFWAFYRRPDSGAVRALTLFCLAMSGFLFAAIQTGLSKYASFSIPYFEDVLQGLGIFSIFFGAFWLNLQLLFPSPRKFVIGRSLLVHGICYLPIIILLLAAALLKNSTIGRFVLGLVCFQVVMGFYFLWKFHSTSVDLLQRRQTRLVLWGSGIGLSGLLILFFLALIASAWFPTIAQKYVIGVLVVIFLAILLSPLSFAYSFGRYRLLEIEGKIRRGTRYLTITVLLLIAFCSFIYSLSGLVLDIFGIDSRTLTIIIALLLAIGFTPTRRKFQSMLEKKIYPERSKLREMLSDFLGNSLAITDKRVFWSELENKLKLALRVDTIYPVLRAAGNGHFVDWNGAITPFVSEGDFIGRIARLGNHPIMRDELEANQKVSLTDLEKAWLNGNRVALILPMVARLRLIGFLGIGFKTEQSDFEVADFEILQSLASQVAVAGENIMLLEESAEKRRLETELSIARKVQEGMLPHDLPNTPGLIIAAGSRFCTEVAGDYYDIIQLGDNRTVMAIGDVSGKGAGAALLMSNVQASIRTAISMESRMIDISLKNHGTVEGSFSSDDLRLTDMMENINELICQNSQPEQFITFFVCIYNKNSKSLIYVNAGHNPPLLIRKKGAVEELKEGGIVLGAMPGMKYERGKVGLSSGDLLFLYTDGASEAENADGEMYGEARLKHYLMENIETDPQGLLRNLEDNVVRFVGDPKLADDFTLLAARVVE